MSGSRAIRRLGVAALVVLQFAVGCGPWLSGPQTSSGEAEAEEDLTNPDQILDCIDGLSPPDAAKIIQSKGLTAKWQLERADGTGTRVDTPPNLGAVDGASLLSDGDLLVFVAASRTPHDDNGC
jgi:hypothetical protein